ncbi:phage tail protein [Phascolarctobacterium succinatutens]|uniref:phage tail protein n=1 Tax=Phascolarctobacterium succinatutens TaxID=626940 RepID=UPI003077B71F
MGLFKGTKFTSRSQKIDAFQSTVCEFGTPVPLLYGTCKVSPNLMCYQDFETKEKRTTQKSGKSKSTTITYLYYVYAELALGEGVISGINKVWVGDTAYAGLGALNANTNNEGAGLALNKGDNSQPTTYMSTNHADIATGYDNLAYLYGRIFLGEDNASMPSYSFEVRGTLIADNTDANPAYVIKDILSKIGLGSYIDEASFADYAKYCANADLLISTPNDAFSRQDKAQTIIANLLEITNTYMYWSVDRFKFAVRDDVQRAEWQPNKQIMYDLTADDFIPQSGAPVTVKRKDSTEIYNYITVNFLNRANNYEEESVSYQDIESIKKYGVRSVTYDAKWYHTKERALKYAQMKTRMAQTECNQYTFQLPWKYCRLEPGDLLRITDEAIGIDGQVVMVSEITEAKTGILTVTAVQRAPGAYSEAKYTVVNDYQYQDFNVEPGNTARPLFIIPPSDLVTSASGCELWIALQGAAKTWGGCNVFISDKDGDYSNIGTQGINSIYGTTAGTMTTDATSAYIRLNNQRPVELLTGSAQDAANGNTLIWINGECMSYTRATLLNSNLYQLTGLMRGQYGTVATAHNYGEDVAVLDGGIYVVPLTKQHIGRTLYFKFPAFNEFKANGQNLADVDCYSCVAAVSDLPNCTDVTAYNKYRDIGGKVVYHDIIVEWSPADFDNYQQAQVWYRQYGEAWRYGGSGYKSATLPQVDIGKRYQIAVCTQDIFGNVETPDVSAQTNILVAISTATPTAPTNLSITLKDAVVIKWDEVRNADIKYYEVRLDNQAGVDNSNFIARVSDASCTTNAVQERKGSVYIFAVSAYGKISAPAKADYSFEAPKAPEIIVDARFQGLECHVNSIPANCIGVHWYISGTQYTYDEKNSNLSFFKSLSAGVYDVKACYYDYFGNGPFSGQIMSSVKATIDNSLLAAEAISTDKLDAATKKALEDAKEAAKLNGNVYTKTETDNQISNTMANFKNGELKSYATITQMNDAISLAVRDVDVDGNTVLTKINLADGTILLDGKYIHITGNTKVDGSIITNDMLAGGITADKIMVNSLSAICATIGTLRTATSGARTEIQDNLIEVYDSNNVLRVKMGVW